MQNRVIGVGVIGCGEIAQLMHLPFLHELPEFRIAGLCDLSPSTLMALGEHYGVGLRATDYHRLLVDPAVDAVVISTYDHAGVVADAIAEGKHVLVEKPLAFTAAEAAPLVASADAKGVVAMVGYMKLYDPGFEVGLEHIRRAGKPWAIHVHDFAGRFDRYPALYTQHKGRDVPEEVLAAGRSDAAARIEAMLGPSHAGYRDLYLMLLMLGSHDLAVMRGAFGAPTGVAYARPISPTQLLAVLDYPDGVACTIEIGFGTRYEWWDEWMAVYGVDSEIRIEFANPYLRYAPATVRLREAAGEAPSERTIHAAQDTAFRREWMHFAACIRSGEAPRTPLSGGLDDLELAAAIIHAMPALSQEAAR